MGKAAADYLVKKFPTPPPDVSYHTPDGLSDELASTLPLAGSTAVAALDAIGLCPGATVIGTASESTFEFLRTLGAEPVAYGAGLVDRVRKLAPDGVAAATNLVDRMPRSGSLTGPLAAPSPCLSPRPSRSSGSATR